MTQLNSASSQNIAMANLMASSSHADSSCSPYRIVLTNAAVSGSTFNGSFAIASKSGERVNMNVNAQISSDGFSFSGYQIPEVTGKLDRNHPTCSWDPQARVCSKRALIAEMTATLT